MEKLSVAFFKWVDMFTRVTTAIMVFAAIYIMLFWGVGANVGVKLLWQILLVAALTSLGVIPWMFSENLSKAAMLVCQTICFLYINAVVLLCGYFFEWFLSSDWHMLLGMEITIILVFVTVFAVSYLAGLRTADKMNQKLRERENCQR